jgi:hypothetical protein
MIGPEARLPPTVPGRGAPPARHSRSGVQLPHSEPDVRFSLIRLTDTVHRDACADYYRTVPVRRWVPSRWSHPLSRFTIFTSGAFMLSTTGPREFLIHRGYFRGASGIGDCRARDRRGAPDPLGIRVLDGTLRPELPPGRWARPRRERDERGAPRSHCADWVGEVTKPMTDRSVVLIDWETSDLLSSHADKNHHELVFPVIRRLLDRSGVPREEIGFLSDAGSDFLDGRGLTTMTIVDALGGHLLEECKIEDDGLWAFCYARLRILAGACDSALVVAYGKSSESEPHWQSATVLDPLVTRPIGLDRLSIAALQSSAYLAAGGGSDRAAAHIASRRRGAATRNPRTPQATPLSEEEALGARFAFGPLRESYLPALADGACAILLGEGSFARRFTDRPVTVSGAGHATDRYALGGRDLTRAPSATAAAERCAVVAGWSASEATVLELSADTPFQEMILCEALGLASYLEGAAILAGQPDGRVNPSGGLLGADPYLVTGLVRLVEAAERVRSDGGRAVAHAASGPALQANAVVALEAGQ